MNDARDKFAVEILADHHHHAALAPVPDGRKNLAVPEGNNKALAAPHGFFIIMPAVNFPAQAATDQQDDEVPQPLRNQQLAALAHV